MTFDDNPFRENARTERVPESCMVVIFGASGDLTRRKLIPALFDLARKGMLPPRFAILGVARTEMDDASFRAHVLKAMKEFEQLRDSESVLWKSFAAQVFYHAMDPGDASGYGSLKERIEALAAEKTIVRNLLLYLSTPPNLYTPIIASLGRSGLNKPEADEHWIRIIIEKPFGYDLDSARKLNKDALKVFSEDQIYRIDHYLGKETVQNLLVFRFANGIFEPLWNRNYIDHVQITAAETVGVENRGSYYEAAGTMRDMVQNHMLQLLALTAMEPPVQFDAQQVRDEKHKIFEAIRPIRGNEVHLHTVRGQYKAGTIGGKDVQGYKDERDVKSRSTTETFVAVRFAIENWRWADVPFYVRSGKRLPKRVTEIAVQFKRTPHRLFSDLPADRLGNNSIVIRIQPDEGISLKFSSKIPGTTMRSRPVTMDFRYGSAFGGRLADAYTRLLNDCMLGDPTLFARGDSVEAAWSLITPIHEGWASNKKSKVHGYPAGQWGPEEAGRMMEREHREWRRP